MEKVNDIPQLKDIARQVRRDIIRMVALAGSGHPGGSFSSADFMTALYFNVMKHDPETWERSGKGQDMFVLSAGHLAPMYYSVLARAGYFPISELGTLRQFGSVLQGHPSIRRGLKGVYQCSGSLGQGLSAAAGLALGKKLDGDPCKVFTLLGDGESEEGQIWEAGIFAAHHKLDNLIAMTDWNGQQIDGQVENVGGLGDLEAKWKAFGWHVIVCDGHDFDAILAAFSEAKQVVGQPVMILFKTIMGKGVGFMAGTHKWHGKAPSAEQCESALLELGTSSLGDF